MARIPTPCACKYRIVVHASTPSTPSGPPHGRWSTRARLPERLGLVSGEAWVLFPAKSTPRTINAVCNAIPRESIKSDSKLRDFASVVYQYLFATVGLMYTQRY